MPAEMERPSVQTEHRSDNQIYDRKYCEADDEMMIRSYVLDGLGPFEREDQRTADPNSYNVHNLGNDNKRYFPIPFKQSQFN
jgi:hypothetical protein